VSIKTWFLGKDKADPELAGGPPADLSGAGPSPNGASPPPVPPIDFVAILEAAGIPADVRDRVVKAKQLLRSMPAGTPDMAKRQIVDAAFQAFEIPTQKIVDGAAAEIAALRAYIQAGEADKEAKLADGERRIADFERQIRETRAFMAGAVAAQERRQQLSEEQIASVQPIVQFFVQGAGAADPARKHRDQDSDVVIEMNAPESLQPDAVQDPHHKRA
jgi:hypothetical protein